MSGMIQGTPTLQEDQMAAQQAGLAVSEVRMT